MPLAGRGWVAFRYPAGGVLSLSPADFAFSLIFCPHPPVPLPAGKGETLRLFMQGDSPLASPGLNPRGTYRTRQAGARSGALPLAGRGWWRSGTPATGWGAALAPLSASGHFTVKAKESVFLWTVPAAKERGDRGRGTSAFEMVLSPGAGRTSASGVQGEPPPVGTAPHPPRTSFSISSSSMRKRSSCALRFSTASREERMVE